jgi:hypothetical protein
MVSKADMINLCKNVKSCDAGVNQVIDTTNIYNVNFQTFAVVHIFAVFFFLGYYPASCLKFKPTFRDHYLSRHQGYNPDDR